MKFWAAFCSENHKSLPQSGQPALAPNTRNSASAALIKHALKESQHWIGLKVEICDDIGAKADLTGT
jgi:hypothetical protein